MQGKRIKEGMIEEALGRFLQDDQALVLGFEGSDKGVRHKIFKGRVDGFAFLNPTFGINGAIYLRRLFSKGARIILMLRPCEIRAYNELSKLAQIERSGITAVSIDCPGTFSSKEKNDDLPKGAGELREYLLKSEKMRPACKTCRERRGVAGDAGIRFDKGGEAWVFPYTEKGDAFLALVEGEQESCGSEMLLGEADKTDKFQSDMDAFSSDFSSCIMCKNCRDMCPVCYCVDCVFNGDEYLPKGDALLNRVLRTGSSEMPQGKDLFHMVRMFHVSQTCVGCGACEEACPQGIPLTKYFKGVSERLQGMFGYVAGRSVDEEIPYLTFLEDELKDAED